MIKSIIEFFRRLFGIKNKVEPYIPVNNLSEWSDIEIEAFNRINAYRLESGLNAIEPEKLGWQQATRRLDVLKQQYESEGKISHNGVGEAFIALGDAKFLNRSEILGLNYSTPESIVNAWKRSEGHNKALLSSVKYCGLSYSKDEKGNKFWCALLYK